MRSEGTQEDLMHDLMAKYLITTLWFLLCAIAAFVAAILEGVI